MSRLLAHVDSVAGQGAVGRRIATTNAWDLARTSREHALGRSIGLEFEGMVSAWAKRLSATAAGGEEGHWSRGLGALLADREALAATLSDGQLLPAVPPGMLIG